MVSVYLEEDVIEIVDDAPAPIWLNDVKDDDSSDEEINEEEQTTKIMMSE